jgi:hypothetical protein
MDRSLSMGLNGALHRARREVLASLRLLPPTARFQVIAYNRQAEPLLIGGHADLLAADAATIQEAVRRLDELHATGGTNHFQALWRALNLRPDAIVLITDADDLTPEEVANVTRMNQGRTVIHVVELNGRRGEAETALRRLALTNRGTYHRAAPE